MHAREPEAFPIATLGYSAGGLVNRGFLRCYPHRANGIAATVQVGAPNESVTSFYLEKVKLAFILVALLLPLTSLTIGTSRADSLAKSGQAYQGLKALEHAGIGAGALTPFEILAGPSLPTGNAWTRGLPTDVRGLVIPSGST